MLRPPDKSFQVRHQGEYATGSVTDASYLPH